MDKPIERTVVWDEAGECWRDKVTGVDVKGMARPLIDGGVPWDYHGSGSYLNEEQAPLQPDDAHSRHIREIARAYLDERTAKTTTMHYFQPSDDALVPYWVLHEAWGDATRQINALERRIYRLERSWWQKLLDTMFGGDGLGWR